MRNLLGTIGCIALLALPAVTGYGLAQAPAADAASCYVRVYTQYGTFQGTVLRSFHTSCPFAKNVTRASLRYIIAAGGAGDGDFYTRAYSPVTHKLYYVHCFANGDLYNSVVRVDCRAGIGARVIYRASSL
jgi:hypothetical protein